MFLGFCKKVELIGFGIVSWLIHMSFCLLLMAKIIIVNL